jgi:outer membrane immunogenic protein
MTRQFSLLFLTLALCLFGTSAWADGMEHPAASACCGTASFAGLYVGGAVGIGQQRTSILNETVGAPAEGLTFKDRDTSVTFGGYVGYNWQRCCSPFVFGVEADFNYLNTSPTGVDVEVGGTGLTETTNLESQIDWFGTLRGRAGFVVHDNVLIYATGGLAYARIDHTLSDDCVGGGVELLHDSHWLLRAEALYVDLGSESESYTIVTPIGTGVADTKWDDQFWVARLGISYKFDGPSCCAAAPLK